MKLIFKYLMRHKIFFLLNMLAVISVVVADLGIPIIIAKLIDDGIPSNDVNEIYKYGFYLFLVVISGTIGNILINFVTVKISTHILIDIRNDVYKKIQFFSEDEINKFGISSLITRTTSDVFQILNFVSTIFKVAFMSPIIIILSLILIIMTTPALLASTIITIFFIVFLILTIILLTKKLSAIQQKNLDRLNLITRENLTGVKVIRAFRKSEHEKKRFKKINDFYTKTSTKLFKIMATAEPTFFLILNIIRIIALFLVGKHVTNPNSNLTVGNVTAYFDYQFMIMMSILLFSSLFIMYPRTIVSANRIKEVLDLDVKIKNNSNPITSLSSNLTLTFKNVNFSYLDDNKLILKDISFEAKKGETIAFVGSTGSGKSSLVSLVARLKDPSSGKILLNDKPLNDYDLTFLREKIGFVPQKTILFNMSIKENLLYGKSNATNDQLINSAKIAQAYDFIMQKENTFDHKISEMGSNLSCNH